MLVFMLSPPWPARALYDQMAPIDPYLMKDREPTCHLLF